MAYRVKRSESVVSAVRRVASEQLDKAIAEVDDEQLDRHETVHQVRKRCKKIRGLIRLVRPQFEKTYERENSFFRDAARRLSYVRDAQSVLETYDALMDHFADQVDREAFASIRDQLVERRREIAKDEVGLDEKLANFGEQMQQAKARIGSWSLDDSSFNAVAGGLKKTYGRARKSMSRAYREPSAEAFHEWRKRVKYHWYHSRLLRRIWSDEMNLRRGAADELSDLLGDDHDLAVFRQTLLDAPDQFGSFETIETFVALIDRRRVELQADAWPLGQRLLAEKPNPFADRLLRYWKVWRKENKNRRKLLRQPALAGCQLQPS